MENKPVAIMIGQDGNVYNLIAIASRALKKEGLLEEQQEMVNRIYDCGSYDEALRIMSEYVDIR